MDEWKKSALVLWFDQVGIEDVGLVGGKNASLGEMYRFLVPKGVSIPNGFCITAFAYKQFIEKTGVKDKLQKLFKTLDVTNLRNLKEHGRKSRDLILNAELPQELKNAIAEGYSNLCKQYGPNTDTAVRSSATAEDLPEASFAGQQESYLNIKGAEMLIESVKKCFASLFTDRAISYRVDKGFDHFKVLLSVGVQKMVRSDLACSGVMFTIDTESGFPDVIFITGSWGLGENIVKGFVNPDEFYVHKPTLRQGYHPIIRKIIGSKDMKLIYDTKKLTKNIPVSKQDRERFVLNDEEILKLAKWGQIIEDHYSEKAGKFKPMDIEWAKDGKLNQLFIVQARPETVMSQKRRDVMEVYELKEKGKIVAQGMSVGQKIGKGQANVILDVKDLNRFKKGQVLVTSKTDPDWEPIMRMAAAIVTDKGGRTSHAAIVSRELGIPCIVGTSNGTKTIKQNQEITASCAEGDVGYVYDGLLHYEINQIDLSRVEKPKTKIMVNVGSPEEAFDYSFLPHEGVGLAREEFIVTSYIKIHPKALIDFERLKDKKLKMQIENLTQGYSDKKQFFVDKLAQGVATIAAAFYPKDVILRFSDFKTNEYANLIGGQAYEPKEPNPMIGWRGASRYYSEQYRDGFALECKAIKKVRDEFGLTNLKVMIPMCRTVDEGRKVLAEMEKNGLKRGENNLEVYVMCEVPSNVIMAEEFADIFDGFSIGSNDLTQFTLAVDRDSELVAHIFDERNEAVKRLVADVILVAKKKGRKIGICGDAPSTYPEFAQFLVEQGIDSISLSPDAVLKTMLKVLEKEKELATQPKSENKKLP